MKTLWLPFIAVFLLASCVARQRTGLAAVPPRWTQAEVGKLRLKPLDPLAVGTVDFSPSGAVTMTAGQKGGPIAGLLFHWEIVSGHLRITDGSNRRIDELTLVSRDGNILTVHRFNGEIVKYKIVRLWW